MPKQAIPIQLCEEKRTALAQFVRQPQMTQQLILRAHIILAAGEGKSNVTIAQKLSTSVETVRLWRNRWAKWQHIDLQQKGIAERLADAPRPGVPARISAEQRQQMEKLADEMPDHRPVSQWTGREIAEEVVRRGIVAHISRRHAARLLKNGLKTS
jgi:putative transposase